MDSTTSSLVALLQSVCVVMVLAYGLTRTRVFAEILDGKRTPKNLAVMAVVFGLFSIYGTLSGVSILGSYINIRDLGPALAGLLAGPLAGLGAGLLGGAHRFTLGGPTCYGCTLSTILAGLVGGLVYRFRGGQLLTTTQAVALALGIEAFHMVAGVVFGTPVATALVVVRSAAVPMLVANALGMAVFVGIVRNVVEERRTRAAKEAIEGELRVARDIQMGIVPRMFPAFPDRPEVELYAMLDSAKEVGGDFYDYYALDENRIFLVIGDVAGKGVPASLFMAVTMTLFKAYTRPERGPVEIAARVNDKLAHDNESGLFVTAFCAILDLRTGRLDYANAGHNLPVAVRPGGTTAFLPPSGGLVLGAMPDFPYKVGTLTLAVGDTLLAYTDGVTEAMNDKNALFGNERLLEACRADRHRGPKELVEGIFQAVQAYAGDAPQSDDITILAVRYQGRNAIDHGP
ncbi:SpoIIE family protein phosphatase [Desulfovibrio sulfodismutans]|uniref:SpoIIE family protein phosphatase n=1 Tax=Desulfolutivibrio sulfodismutans TaxID=63561 RepID=A0A7K3NN83_9BACT|nr:SpoIIE family protein phosphatase [Desulfolutivibrio sulfodismutans]NDY57662.1 SpoIIE family protein phosphatase [Desulfolutivibrio sulfodismutans]QLA11410.1 SpoIIE family protein phosphatase [Desulfolutivibrio sulfodismutans DSM 3696]